MNGNYLQNKKSIYNYQKKNPEKIKQIRAKVYLKRKFKKNLLKEILKQIIKMNLTIL
jgi:hypothetical protein